MRKNSPGLPTPLGATWDGSGVNFAIEAKYAQSIKLCLFNDDGITEKRQVVINSKSDRIWHIYVPQIRPGQLYGYRVNEEPELLMDPYALAISGKVSDIDESEGEFSGPKAVVVDRTYNWESVGSPSHDAHTMVIYEAHVKGISWLHPGIPEHIRGTFLAIGHHVMISYLRNLGVTSIELMPVHHCVIDGHQNRHGLKNYWGYDTVGYCAPDGRYSTSREAGCQVREFKDMVKALHTAGIEVILDVAYFNNIDHSPGRHIHPVTAPDSLTLLVRSLRYWIEDMHVDGFRFGIPDSRDAHVKNEMRIFFEAIHNDPVISRVKLITAPISSAKSGHTAAHSSEGWLKWNTHFRDCVRDFWKGTGGMNRHFAVCFMGSTDRFKIADKVGLASINFVSAHDGFTLHDLVSYNEKHNEANGEDNEDGISENYSFNYGTEGATVSRSIRELRSRQKRNLLASLFLSQGIPMITAGDELGRTQRGNNNAYCQDNEISWLDWEHADAGMLRFTAMLIAFRKQNTIFSRRCWPKELLPEYNHLPSISWFLPDGSELKGYDWPEDADASVAALIGDDFNKYYVMFNALDFGLPYRLPQKDVAELWHIVLDTAQPDGKDDRDYQSGSRIYIQDRQVLVWKARPDFYGI